MGLRGADNHSRQEEEKACLGMLLQDQIEVLAWALSNFALLQFQYWNRMYMLQIGSITRSQDLHQRKCTFAAAVDGGEATLAH